MAKYGSDKVAFLLIDGYSVLGSVTDLKEGIEAVTEETTPLGASWVTHEAVGLKQATLEQSGFYDDAVNGVHLALVGANGTSRVVNYGVEGNTLGSAVVCWRGVMQANYQRIVSRGALHKANATYKVNGTVEEGVILTPLAAVTTDGDSESTSHDNAAASIAGASFYLQVSALDLDGLAGAVVKVYDSANNVD